MERFMTSDIVVDRISTNAATRLLKLHGTLGRGSRHPLAGFHIPRLPSSLSSERSRPVRLWICYRYPGLHIPGFHLWLSLSLAFTCFPALDFSVAGRAPGFE